MAGYAVGIDDTIKTPDCPRCGMPPRFTFFTPYMCVNPECEVLHWNPYQTLAEIRAQEPVEFDMDDLTFTKIEHVPSTRPAPKMGYRGAMKGICSCGWESNGAPTNEHHALKNAKAHADAKNAEA